MGMLLTVFYPGCLCQYLQQNLIKFGTINGVKLDVAMGFAKRFFAELLSF